MCVYILWLLIMIAGLAMALYAVQQYRLRRVVFHFRFYLVFVLFSAGFGLIGYLEWSRHPAFIQIPLWAVLTIIALLLLAPVFRTYFDSLAADRGGFCMEAGLIAMLIGFMQIIIGGSPWIPLFGMMSLSLFYLGYVRLGSLVEKH